MEWKNRVTRHGNRKVLWLLLVLGLGLYLLAARRARGPAGEAETRQAYSFAQGCARRQLGQDYFGRDLRRSPITLRFPPFDRRAVVPLGEGRWRCEHFQARTFGLPP